MYRRINFLLSTTQPGYTNERMIAPFCKLTIGNIIREEYGYFDKIDLSIKDGSS
ncbi:MAG: hypothetical protein H8E13_14185 [Actinobacteria bacterium]|nr:hypothetical protein [Actinomycetota bacterium]